MKRRRPFDKIIYGSLYTIIIVFIFIMIAFAIKSNKNSDSPYEKVSLWEKGWILETPDGKNKSVTIPTEKVDTAEFKKEITVTVNGSRIYSYTPQYEKYINTDLAAEQYRSKSESDRFYDRFSDVCFGNLLCDNSH